MLNIGDLSSLCRDENTAMTKHAKSRLAERGITVEDIQNAIRTGEIIKQYEHDKPFPSCLVLGSNKHNKHIHVVASVDSGYLYIITAYYPDENEWQGDFKTRRGQKS